MRQRELNRLLPLMDNAQLVERLCELAGHPEDYEKLVEEQFKKEVKTNAS